MSAIFSAKLTGVKEIQQSLNTMIQRQESVVIPAALNDAADIGVRVAKEKAHVVTGAMKANIGKKSIGRNSIEVHSLVRYAGIENERKGTKAALGTHDYFTQSRDAVIREFPQMLATRIETNIKQNKASPV